MERKRVERMLKSLAYGRVEVKSFTCRKGLVKAHIVVDNCPVYVELLLYDKGYKLLRYEPIE